MLRLSSRTRAVTHRLDGSHLKPNMMYTKQMDVTHSAIPTKSHVYNARSTRSCAHSNKWYDADNASIAKVLV